MRNIEDIRSEHEDLYSTYGEASKIELIQLLESMKTGSMKRKPSTVSTGDEQGTELEMRAKQARISQLKVSLH